MLAVKLCVLMLVALCHIVASERAIVCYYGTWATYRWGLGKYDVENIDPHLCTHLVYTFTGIDYNGNMISLDPYLDLPDNWGRDNFRKFNALKERNPRLKTLLAVGGWNEGSAKYSQMVASPELRRNFINTALNMVTQYGFDGLDLDWEYPNQRDTVHGWADVDNFTTLLRELKDEFGWRGLLLTAAVASVRVSAEKSYDIPAISRYLDLVNIMAYDLHGGWDPVTGHNAPLHRGEGDHGPEWDLWNVEQTLNYWIGAGCPREKIVVGLPLYGRTFALRNAHENGLRVPVNGFGLAGPYTGQSGTIGYNEFCHKLETEPWNRRYDSQARVPYAFLNHDWVSYDDTESLIAKIDFSKRLGIDKFMVWSIETDDFHGLCGQGVNPLLRTINARA